MKEEDKTKVEPIKDLKTLRKKREKSAVNNITKRKQAEEELKDSEEYLKILFDYAPDAYYISDIKGKFIDGNKAAERLIGYKREKLIGKSFLKLKLLSLADIPKAAKLLVKNFRGQPTGSDEFVLNRKDNSKVTVEISTYPVKIKGKTLALGIARDITERKQAEEALLKALAQANKGKRTLDALMEQVPEGITIADAPDVLIRMVSRYGRELTGKSKEILEGITVDKHTQQWDIYCKDGVTPAKNEDLPLTRATQEGELVKDEEWVLGNQFKGRIPILCNAGPIRDEEGNITGGVIVWRDITERKQAEEKLKKTLDASIETMSKIIEVKDPYTAGHQQRVSLLTTAIAKELNLSPDKVEGIRIASLIHDIGKISVPTEILSKTTTLSDIEFSLIKGHSQAGSDILKAIDFSYPVAQIVLQHHEKLNGSGYPNKLKGDKILLEARILGVADVVEAMSSHRPYRPALGIDVALEEISKNKGILYDPKIVDVCIKLFKEKGFKFDESASN